MPSLHRLLLLSCAFLTYSVAAIADNRPHANNPPPAQPQSIVDKAASNAQDFFIGADTNSKLVHILSASRAVMVCSSQTGSNFGLNRSSGPCALLARDRRGIWSDPAFYTMTSGKDFKFGMDDGDTKFMFFILTDKGFLSILDRQFTFNPRSGPSYADVDMSTNAAQQEEQNADILTVRKTNEQFVKSSIRGSKFSVNSGANWAYYKQAIGPEDILIRMQANNPNSNLLRRVLFHYSRMGALSAHERRDEATGNSDF